MPTDNDTTPWSGARCFVTGAGGFIGRALCAELSRRGAIVHASGRTAPNVPNAAATYACDVSDIGQVRRALEQAAPDVVYHCASRVTGSRELEMVLPTFYDTLVGTVNVLHAVTEMRTPARVVCLGSLHEPDEGAQTVAPSPYAAAKYSANTYLRMYAELHSLPASIGRPFMVYGAGQVDYAKVVPYVTRSLLTGRIARLSSGRAHFDWVYVSDVVDALLAIGARDDLAGATVDIGTGTLTSVREVVLGIGRRLDAEHLLVLDALPDRRLEPTRVADLERTANLIDWRPTVGVEEGLDRAVDWYRAELLGP